MKKATDVLRDEHRLITRAGACLDRVVDYALENEELCVISALELLEFFEGFADVMHQEKEERHLFPAMLAEGLANYRVQGLLDDHRSERTVLNTMRDNLEGAAFGDASSHDLFITSAARYVTQQSNHVAEEEQVLMPLAEELLSDEAQLEVLEGFREVEAELLPSPYAHYLDLLSSAAIRLGSALPAGGGQYGTICEKALMSSSIRR